MFLRLQVIQCWLRFLDRRITRRLDRLLDDAVRTARAGFGGPVTYAAAYWEDVDWSRFDLAGINLYAGSGVHGCFVFTFAMRDFPAPRGPAG